MGVNDNYATVSYMAGKIRDLEEKVKILTPDKPYSTDELSSMWPTLRAELLAHAVILEREPTVENAQVRVGIKAAVQMGDGYARLMKKPRTLGDFESHDEYMVARRLAP